MGKKEELKELLVNKQENCSKSDKRNGKIEKIQLSILKEALNNLNKDFKNNVNIDTTIDIKKKKNQWLIREDGSIKNAYKIDRNPFYDSKTFDYIVPIDIENKSYTLFFILKGVEYSGGHQDETLKEIGLYSNYIRKNKDDNYLFVFLLDGSYINKHIKKLKKSKKYFNSTSEKIENDIKNFITKKLINHGK